MKTKRATFTLPCRKVLPERPLPGDFAKEVPITETVPENVSQIVAPHVLSDPSLLEALGRGERAAFDTVFDAAFACVFAAVSREVEKDVRAHELTDRVLTAAFRSLDPARPPASLAHWLAAWTRQVLSAERTNLSAG